uniref:Uncharacterized protein n=1 Tax=Anguilla anguilla TaxID=7936 RepID=A0A0E9T5H4_ANGAN
MAWAWLGAPRLDHRCNVVPR